MIETKRPEFKMCDSTKVRLNDGILRGISTLGHIDHDVWIRVWVSNMTTGARQSFFEDHGPEESWFDFAQNLYQNIYNECTEEWRESTLGNIDDLTIDSMSIAGDYTME